MKKPPFLWWAHKELWETIAKENLLIPLIKIKRNAHSKLLLKYPFLPKHVAGYCFACDVVSEYNMPGGCRSCPLDWNVSESEMPYCFCANSPYDIFEDALDDGNDTKARELALQIANLPLKKDAYELYDVKETPND